MKKYYTKKMEKKLKELFKNLNNISEEIKVYNKEMFNLLYTIIDYELEIASLNYIVLDYKNNTFSEILLSLCYKNTISLLSALKLIEQGYLGSAKIIFRNVYESLLIGKLFGTTKNYKYYEKWIKGEQLSIKKEVFYKLKNKTSKENLEFWDILNKYTHSTPYSQDFILEIDKKEIDNCNTIISTLLEMNYHLLNTFVSNYYNYYLVLYCNNYYKEKKNKLKDILIVSRSLIDPRCKKVLNDYKAKWILKM